MTENIASPEHKADPFPFYARLRDEAPVTQVPVTMPGYKSAWLVTRYDDVVAVLKDERFVKDRRNIQAAGKPALTPWLPGALRSLEHTMLDVDEPDHMRLRSLVNMAFTPRAVEQLRARIASLADTLLTAAQGQPQFDLISSYALPMPTTIIAELLGVPVADRHKFSRWSSAIVTSPASMTGMLRMFPSAWMFLRYIRRQVRARRAAPGDDLLSALVLAEDNGARLSEDELLATAFLLLVAGHETTVNLIGNGTLALLRNPDQLARLREEPELIKPAVEELLRYAGPLLTATERYAREDVAIAGVTIPRGALVFAALASANRDEHQFPDADTLDVTREPNRHVAFGLGAHYCVGAPLARLEGQIALTTLLDRVSDLHLAVPPATLKWRPGLVLRGLQSLPVAVEGWR
jgi:cytochrome P450